MKIDRKMKRKEVMESGRKKSRERKG